MQEERRNLNKGSTIMSQGNYKIVTCNLIAGLGVGREVGERLELNFLIDKVLKFIRASF